MRSVSPLHFSTFATCNALISFGKTSKNLQRSVKVGINARVGEQDYVRINLITHAGTMGTLPATFTQAVDDGKALVNQIDGVAKKLGTIQPTDETGTTLSKALTTLATTLKEAVTFAELNAQLQILPLLSADKQSQLSQALEMAQTALQQRGSKGNDSLRATINSLLSTIVSLHTVLSTDQIKQNGITVTATEPKITPEDAAALNALGMTYKEGRGVPKDYIQAPASKKLLTRGMQTHNTTWGCFMKPAVVVFLKIFNKRSHGTVRLQPRDMQLHNAKWERCGKKEKAAFLRIKSKRFTGTEKPKLREIVAHTPR